MKKFEIGIIGNGFVGESQAYTFSSIANVKIYDIDPVKRTHDLEEVLQQKFIFVCLPTPMTESGVQDDSYIRTFFDSIEPSRDTIFILKSTVLPGTTKELKEKHGYKIVFCPEFLTEKTAKLDMLTQPRIVIGGEHLTRLQVLEIFKVRFGNKHYILTDETTAEYIKYMSNIFLAVKVSTVNEFYRLGKVLGIDWNVALEGFTSDPRIGNSHTAVPGHDGKLGFGGSCFPKDINALIQLSYQLGVEMNVLEAAWKTNLEVRAEQDWKQLKGRAVSA